HGEDHVPDKFLTAADVDLGGEHAQFKPVVFDAEVGDVVAPNGSAGHRWDSDAGNWNLDPPGVTPRLTMYEVDGDSVVVRLPRFDTVATLRRGVPVRRIGTHLVTTVFDLMMAQYGVARGGLPGDWPSGYDDPATPYTPAWQEEITSVPATAATRVAREFAQNAERTEGRSMIAMGAGTNHWFHSDEIYRSFLALLQLCGCQGVNGGGWAHYVGQEK